MSTKKNEGRKEILENTLKRWQGYVPFPEVLEPVEAIDYLIDASKYMEEVLRNVARLDNCFAISIASDLLAQAIKRSGAPMGESWNISKSVAMALDADGQYDHYAEESDIVRLT